MASQSEKIIFLSVNQKLHIRVGPQRGKETFCIMKWMLFWKYFLCVSQTS